MPTYPTPSAYQEAIQFPEDAFRDPALQQARPDENRLGLPQPITGHFAAVFPVTTRTGRRWAVKCFLTDVPRQQRRYRRLAAHLADQDLSYTVGFAYQEEGIAVDGAVYPILKMEWADGVPLNRFVEMHLDAPDTLAALAETWAAMLDDLEAAEVAHGDLQHGNVLVREEDGAVRLALVDYDTMVVPGLDRGTSPEVGHRNYQHPDRTETDVGFYLDRFPGLVIYTALQACVARPALWSRFDSGENLLFRAADFYDPSSSVLLETLGETPSLAPLVEALRAACYAEPEAVPPLAAVRAGETGAAIENASVSAATRRRRRRAVRTGFARWFLPGAMAVAGIAAGLGFAGYYVAVAVFVGMGLVLSGWEVARRYRQQSLVRRRRRLQEERDYFDALIQSLERQRTALRTKRREERGTVDERRERRLKEVREEALYDRLKYHFIGEVAGIEGVTHKHVIRLKKAGIRTAYEARPAHIQSIRTLGETTTARIAMWRAALVREYADALPDALSPAEERRIQRYVERRIDSLDAELVRTKEKTRVQHAERERVVARLEEMPAWSLTRYLCYLLRLDARPTLSEGPPRPPASVGAEEVSSTEPTVSAPTRAPDDGPWWKGVGREHAS